MTVAWFASLSGGEVGLAVHFAVGIVLGAVYFRGLLWNARLFAEGASLRVTVGLLLGRLVLLAGLLTLASMEGAMQLLVTALGVFAGRYVVMHAVRRLAP